MSPKIYETGEGVEVKRTNSWFPATVFSSNEESDKKLMIQYIKIDAVDSVPVAIVRPAPPRAKREKFRIGDFIEAFQGSKGWRGGKLVGFCENVRCAVVFCGEEKATSVPFQNVRPCLHWIRGSWISHSVERKILQRYKVDEPQIATTKLQKRRYFDSEETEPLKKKVKVVPSQTVGKAQSLLPKKNHNRIPCHMISCSKFKVGSQVEVKSDEVGYEGAWFTATIVAFLGQKRYRVEYHTIKTDDLKHFLQEEVKEEYIRPFPPKSGEIRRYRKGEAVDLWYNEGWWEGVILRVDDESTYVVYFDTTDEKLTCSRSSLRPHRDWIDWKWISPSPCQ